MLSLRRFARCGAQGDVRVPPHERLVLDNGATLVIVPRPDVPLVACTAVLRGGALGDPAQRPGVASLTAGLLEKGAGGRNAFAFADAIEEVGGSFGAAAGAESITLSAQFLARDQRRMLDLLADALLRPRLAAAELDKLRMRQIELIKAAKDSDPAELIGTYGRAFLFRPHPYSRPVIGSEGSLAAITHRDVLDYHQRQLGADRLALVFAGDVSVDWVVRAVERAFAGWARARVPPPPLARPARVRTRRVLLIDAPGAVQTHFWIGSVGVDKRYPRRAALDLVNTLYGGCFTSILNTELRIKSGLSYGAVSGFTHGAVPGEFALRSFTQIEHTTQALDLALLTLQRLKRGRLLRRQLDSARAYVLGQYPLSLETAADWAAALGELELYGLGPEYIEGYGPALRRVRLRDARAVIEQVFPDAEDVAIVVIGDAAKIRGRLTRYGHVTQIPLAQAAFDAGAAHP